jgi:hypothetical protein
MQTEALASCSHTSLAKPVCFIQMYNNFLFRDEILWWTAEKISLKFLEENAVTAVI